MNHLHDKREFQQFVDNHVLYCQSSLVDQLLKESACGISFDDITNAYDEEEDEYREIFEWWLCDSWLLEKLDAKNQPILYTDYGNWWGRCTTGQACALDEVLQEIWIDLQK